MKSFHRTLIGLIPAGLLALTSSLIADLPHTIFNVRPTLQQMEDELARADLVIRARVAEILFHRGGNHADEDVLVDVLQVYKGKPISNRPCVRLEVYWHRYWDEIGPPDLPRVGDELFLPIEAVPARAGSPPPAGQRVHYMAPFYYKVEDDDRVSSIFGFPSETAAHAVNSERFATLIKKSLQEPRPPRLEFELGEVLFSDNFDDGSIAGWTFLEGTKIRKPFTTGDFTWRDAVNYLWVGPLTIQGPALGFDVKRNPKSGNFKGERRGTTVEFGVVNGRLRLRSHHFLHHITAVTGDPEWTDYQLDVDMWKYIEPANPHGPRDYKKFGPYGRVAVPNFPFTEGEHSFVAVEIGNFANYDVSERTWGDSAFQLRCKYPEPKYIERDPSRLLRFTQILDYTGYDVPEATKMHVTARFMGRYVEGWIDGEKILDGEIPADHPGATKGRVALWTFETFAEFDNLKITRLNPKQP